MTTAEAAADPRLERWEATTRWPLIVASFAFLFAYTLQVVGELHGPARIVTSSIVGATWVLFVVDYLARLSLSHPRGSWFRRHLFDLAVVLIPVLRPIRLLGALTRVPSLSRTAGSSLRARMLIYGAGAGLLLIWMAALTVLEAERSDPGANIRSFPDALWWAFCTVTTVGYGDYTPVTVLGRIIAVGLMVGGVVLVGLVTATFASWVLERATRGHEDQQPATRADVHRVLVELLAAEKKAEQERTDGP